jgi:hypothetical protein
VEEKKEVSDVQFESSSDNEAPAPVEEITQVEVPLNVAPIDF